MWRAYHGGVANRSRIELNRRNRSDVSMTRRAGRLGGYRDASRDVFDILRAPGVDCDGDAGERRWSRGWR